MRKPGCAFSIKGIDLSEVADCASPVTALDHFRVRGQTLPPQPHAGLSAFTYVFEDSEGSLRKRDSLGNDVVVGPGGIVWTQADSDVIHHEIPVDEDRELHCLRLFVNHGAKHRYVGPRMLRLQGEEVREWWHSAGDGVRVVAGSFEGITSPLVPAEPFTFLDVVLRREITFNIPTGHNALVYVLEGSVAIGAAGRQQKITPGQALALHGGGGRARLVALSPAHAIVLSGPEIREAMVVDSLFMNEAAQIGALAARYGAGEMERVASF
jgi:redox-sensitive bicupin YhaK (pirin superfamily)